MDHKFKMGQEVFFLEYGKIAKTKIQGIIRLVDGKQEYVYFLEERKEIYAYGWKKEKDIFSSREELIKSL